MQNTVYPLNIDHLRQSYINKKLTPRQLIQDIHQRMERYSDYNIWIHALTEDELEPYLSSLEKKDINDYPLYGIPFAIKDNIDLENIPTTAACPEFSYTPDSSAFVVDLLVKSGAIPIGKTNLDQFATGLVGTRSPYGAVNNAFKPEYISGGSSSGSAVAVALNIVSFALGTDTAGSGRIPAAFNNLIGLKPSKGLLSTSGVVPACRSLDCVSLFTLNPDDAQEIFTLTEKYDPDDIYALKASGITKKYPLKRIIGVPDQNFITSTLTEEYKKLFNESIGNYKKLSYEVIEINFEPFSQAADLLYAGPWLAERYISIKQHANKQPNGILPVTSEIITAAEGLKTVNAFEAMYQLQAFKKQADNIFQQVDSILTPTACDHFTIQQVNADPISLNSQLGKFTNFMNLLDLCAIAFPAGFTKTGLPFGATLFTESGRDRDLINTVKEYYSNTDLTMGTTKQVWNSQEIKPEEKNNTIDIAVCGAHLSGMKLNYQLTDLGAKLKQTTTTSKNYRFFVLDGGPPYRPGLMRDEECGDEIEVEVWSVPLHKFAEFMKLIPAPLGIGKLELINGDWVNGFICEAYAIKTAKEITEFKSWRLFTQQLEK